MFTHRNLQERPEIRTEYVEKIRGSFLESMYTFLDGLVRLAFSDYIPLNEKEELQLAKQRDKIDVHSMVTANHLANMFSQLIDSMY